MTASLPAPLDVKLMNLTATVLFVGCAAFVLVVGGSWMLRHPAFAIRRIVVQGELVHNNAVTLRANVGPHLVGNFFTVDLRAVREAFEQVPWVRHAMVRREFPNSLRVELQEHDAAAYWGAEEGSTLVNSQGEVFEANGDDLDADDLPRLQGPQGQSLEVLQMYHRLQPVFEPLDTKVDALELTGRGGWRATLDSGAVVELGGGTPQDVVQRTQRFVRTLARVAGQYGRRADALESADLRHADGYALRLRGVTTVNGDAPKAAARAPARTAPQRARPARTTGQNH
ncbi:cell division protein FtsQ/DivIB [Acidovorax sp. SUPP1855]|uniref:cell division protein FtsQ/DivIB n=1 Tax=Acidovorax sp. SUPP1855 TaxID=431774 RepID=UPI0023DE4418|nr:cell division protein FtsQ/DivIB [Acidovorax sp. SUPP1855]GKS84823.1 cell division protein FtsQ/DivIB [Acidovorax sp. SUPP1855]